MHSFSPSARSESLLRDRSKTQRPTRARPASPAMIASFTNVPSFLNTWIRSLPDRRRRRRPSNERSTQWTGLRNCCAGGAVRIVRTETEVVGLVAIGAPVTLLLAGLGVDHRDPLVEIGLRHRPLPPGHLRHNTGKAQRLQVEFVNEDIDDADRIVLL